MSQSASPTPGANEKDVITIDDSGQKQGNENDPKNMEEPPSVYRLKWIRWKGRKSPIITQNENGPCPLIAIMNVLILRGRVVLQANIEYVSPEQLMGYLGDAIVESVPKNLNESAQLNYEQNVSDAMQILPKLQTGLDVNVKFTEVTSFEYTSELVVFDLLRIMLYHGWLVDPSHEDVQKSVGSDSYNQLVDKIIRNKTSTDAEGMAEALLAEEFLAKTASQLTKYGLRKLIERVNEDELCVLFRNNHFITLYKYKGGLYQLVTDQGFLSEPNVVWETLDNIEGDGRFVDGNFVIVPPKESLQVSPDPEERQQQVDQDYLLALSLQQEQTEMSKGTDWNQELTDEELAKKLQEEEQARYDAELAKQQRQQQNPSRKPSPPVTDPAPVANALHPSTRSNLQGSSRPSGLAPNPSESRSSTSRTDTNRTGSKNCIII